MHASPDLGWPDSNHTKFSLAEEVLRSFGRLKLKVIGTSMLPALWPGDLLTIELAPFSSIRPGDLAFYSREGRFFVHRVIGKECDRNRLMTRGDALPEADLAFVPDLLGRVVGISRAGREIRPSAGWWRFQRLVGLMFCHVEFARGMALRYREREAKAARVPTGPQAANAGDDMEFGRDEAPLRECAS